MTRDKGYDGKMIRNKRVIKGWWKNDIKDEELWGKAKDKGKIRKMND